MISTILTLILLLLGCGDCVFLGIVLTLFQKYEPALYGWDFAAYGVAVFWAIWFAVEFARLFDKSKRKQPAKSQPPRKIAGVKNTRTGKAAKPAELPKQPPRPGTKGKK